MDDDLFVTLEIDFEGRSLLELELPPDMPAEEIRYIKTLVARAEIGSIDLLDPDTLEVVLSFRPVVLH
jgi:hypothetical protein